MNKGRVLQGRKGRNEQRRKALKNEILAFAGKVRGAFGDREQRSFHLRLSEFTEHASYRQLARYKRDVQGMRKDDDYPLKVIMGKEGESAGAIADFLGVPYVEACVQTMRSAEGTFDSGAIMDRWTGENGEKRGSAVEAAAVSREYLKWAVKHGGREVKAHALAGIAYSVAERMDDSSRPAMILLEKNGEMGVLRRALGEDAAEGAVKKTLRKMKNAWMKGAAYLGLGAGVFWGMGKIYYNLMGDAAVDMKYVVLAGVCMAAAVGFALYNKHLGDNSVAREIFGELGGKDKHV